MSNTKGVASAATQPSYGSVGRARYNSATLRWEFERRLTAENVRLEVISQAILAEPTLPEHPPHETELVGLRQRRLLDFTTNYLPILCPASSTLLQAERLSKTVDGAAAQLLPDLSDVVAFGRAAPSLKNPRGFLRPAPFMAHTTGLSGEIVQLTAIQHESQYRDSPHPHWLQLPRLDDSNTVQWRGTSSCAIQQLCASAATDESASFLAIRTSSGTTIAKPEWRVSTTSGLDGLEEQAGTGISGSSSRISPDMPLSLAYGETLHGDISQFCEQETDEQEFAREGADAESVSQTSSPSGSLDAAPVELSTAHALSGSCHLSFGKMINIDHTATGGARHIDIDLNPWDHRNLAILDSTGHWTAVFLQGSGNGYRPMASSAKRPGMSHVPATKLLCDEEWGRIVWAGNIRTLVACSRRDIMTFTIGSKTKISLTKLILANDDKIWDLKRDPFDSGRVFLLTCSHVVWLRIAAPSHPSNISDQTVDPTVVLSWSHFWNNTSIYVSLALTSVPSSSDENGAPLGVTESVGVLIYNRVTKFAEMHVASCCGSPSVSYSVADPLLVPQSKASHLHINVLFNPLITVTTTPKGHDTRTGDVNYFQMIEVDAQLCLKETILVLAPTSQRSDGPAVLDDPRNISAPHRTQPANSITGNDPIRKGNAQKLPLFTPIAGPSRMFRDYRWVADRLYTEFENETNTTTAPFKVPNWSKTDSGSLSRITILRDLFDDRLTADNLEHATRQLGRFFDAHPPRTIAQNSKNSTAVTVRLTADTMQNFLTGDADRTPVFNVLAIYRYLLRTFINPLPHPTGTTRAAQEHIASYVALELFLSSFGWQLPPAPRQTIDMDLDMDLDTSEPPSQSQTSTQRTEQDAADRYDPTIGLSRYTHIPAREPLPLQLSRVLDDWVVGADPAGYDWLHAREVANPSSVVVPQRRSRGAAKSRTAAGTAASQGKATEMQPAGSSQGSQLVSSSQVQVPTSQTSLATSQSQSQPGLSQSQRNLSQASSASAAKKPKKRRKGF